MAAERIQASKKQKTELRRDVVMTSPEEEKHTSFQSEHEKKFDRQIRLWGKHGQTNIEKTKIVVLGAGPTASETLKNLVLPNVGEFTIVDDQLVAESDLGNNFFVTSEEVGKSRALVVKNLLLEMNPDVTGHHITKNPLDIIANDIDFFSKYTIVVCTQIVGSPVQKLAAHCFLKRIPLVIVRSFGLLGYVRNVVPEHLVIESHPETDLQDLYIHPGQLARFPEMKEFLDSFDLSNKDLNLHAHIPFIAVLYHIVQQWQQEHGGSLPTGFEEEMAFSSFIKSQAVQMDKEKNFSEALNAVYKSYKKPRIDSDVQNILNDKQSEELTADSDAFWILVAALKRFIAHEGCEFFPVSTDIPDMTTDTQSYVKIKEIYKAKHEADIEVVKLHVRVILKEIRLPDHTISDEEIAYFVKHCRSLICVRTRSLEEEYSPETANKGDIAEEFMEWELEQQLEEQEQSTDEEAPKPFVPMNLHWYFALRAVEEFHSTNGRFPCAATVEHDIGILKTIADTLYKSLDIDKSCPEECLYEMVRFEGAEMHNIAAFVGGVTSQLVLKLATKQYKPLDNTLLFNGIHGSASVWTL